MNFSQYTRNDRNPCLKQNRPDRSYRDTLLKWRWCKLKRDDSPKHFHFRKDKGDLKGFQTNFETLFLLVSVTIWHLSIRENIKKKHKNIWKTTELVWLGLSRQCFLQKQSMSNGKYYSLLSTIHSWTKIYFCSLSKRRGKKCE